LAVGDFEVVHPSGPFEASMRHPEYLYRSRHGIFYFRVVMPKNLRLAHPTLPKELKASLKCSNRRVAATNARQFYLGWLQAKTVLENAVEELRLSGFTLIERPHCREVHTTPADTPEQLAVLFAYLERTGGRLPPALAQLLEANVAPVSVALATPASVPSPRALPIDSNGAVVAQPPSGLRFKWLSEAIDEWHREQVAKGIWSVASTFTNSHGPSARVFRELIAREQRVPEGSAKAIWDIPMSSITMEDIESYVKAMWDYPDRQGKRTSLSGDAKAVLARGGKAQTRVNAKKHMGHVAGLLEWAIIKKYAAVDTLTILRLAMKGPTEDEDSGYRAFSTEELARIFDSPAYREDRFENGWQYWSPLVALNTACRIREFSDMTVDDVIEVNGLPCIWFRGGTVEEVVGADVGIVKRVKTISAERIVPIASNLIALGFLEYVDGRRATGKVWMWDNLLWESKSGFGRYITKWFGDYLREVGVKPQQEPEVKTPRHKTYHSFRATLRQRLDTVSLDTTVITRVIGHVDGSTLGKNYTRDPDGRPAMPVELVQTKLDAIEWKIELHPSVKWGGMPALGQR
jgi:hypothetical protein